MKTCIFVGLAAILIGGPYVDADEPQVTFRNDIAAILRDNCLACHGAKKAEGGYRVDSYSELLKAGDSGQAPIAESAPSDSELLRRILSPDESERMPAESEPLTSEQIAAVKLWIEAGAKFDGADPDQSLLSVIPPAQFPEPPAAYSHAVPVAAIAFSPDGKLIATSGYYEVLLWNAADGNLVRRIKNLAQRVFALEFSADGKSLAVGCGEPGKSGEVRLIEFETGKIMRVIARAADVVFDLAFRPGTTEIAVAAADNSIRIVDWQSSAELRTIASHADWVTAVAWSDDGKRLASASRDRSAKVYDGATGELISSYLGHGAAVRGVVILSDNAQIASVGADGKLHRWEIEGGKKIAEIALGGDAHQVVRSAGLLLVPCSDKRLLQIDLSNNTIGKEFQGHSDWVLAACYQPRTPGGSEPELVASGSFDGEIRLWNVRDAAPVRSWIAKPQ